MESWDWEVPASRWHDRAIPLVRAHRELIRMAERHGRTVSQIVFRFAIDVGMVPLTGTTDAGHMREDLDVFDFRLEPKEVAIIEALIAP